MIIHWENEVTLSYYTVRLSKRYNLIDSCRQTLTSITKGSGMQCTTKSDYWCSEQLVSRKRISGGDESKFHFGSHRSQWQQRYRMGEAGS